MLKLTKEKLRQARQEASLTQADVAKKLRRLQSFVSKVESGERRVDVVELAEFARLYDKPLSYFVGELTLYKCHASGVSSRRFLP